MQINIDQHSILNSINPSFKQLLVNKDRFLVLRGSAGSGKSVFTAQKFLLRIISGMKKGYQHRILALRKASPHARSSVFKEFRDLVSHWGMTDICKINKTEMSLNFIDGSEILCSGLDDPEKIKSIAGLTSVWLEEAPEFSIDHFRQINLRLRGKTEDYYQMVMSFNPVSKQTWLFSEFFENPKANATCHHSVYTDNLYLDDAYKQELENYKDIDRYYYMVYALGEWGVLGGLIYNNWKEVERFPKNVNMKIHGIDFGYSNSETSVVGIGKGDHGFFCKELLYQKKMTNQDLIDWLERNVKKSDILYADSAEPARIMEIKRAGFYIKPAKKGKNSVINGIDYLKRQKLFITSDSVNMLKEIASYKWKEDKKQSSDNEKVYLDQPVPVHDHCLDGARYGIWSHWGKPKSNVRVRFI